MATSSKDAAAQPLALGQPANVRGLVVTVVEMKRTARAVPVADGATGLFPTSVPGVASMRDGEELLGLHVRYANRGNAAASIEPTDWFVRPELQGLHLNAGIAAASFGDPLRSTSLPTSVTRDGWLAFVVPSNSPDAVAGYRLISTLGRAGASGGETIGALWHVGR